VKGAAAIIVARLILTSTATLAPSTFANHPDWTIVLVAFAVILGHLFPVWLHFRGGKGVATAIGVFLILAPWTIAGAAVVFLVVVWFTRYVSLGSMVAAICIPILVLLLYASRLDLSVLMATSIGIAALIVFAHRGNIRRLRLGTESRFK